MWPCFSVVYTDAVFFPYIFIRFSALVRISTASYRTLLDDLLIIGARRPSFTVTPSRAVMQTLRAQLAPSTQAAYLARFDCYRCFVLERGSIVFPVPIMLFLTFLQTLVDSGRLADTVRGYIFAVTWAARVAGYTEPVADDSLVAAFSSGLTRVCLTATRRGAKAPWTIEMYHRVFDMRSRISVSSGRDVVMIAVQLHGFLRASELLGLRQTDVAGDSDCMCLTIARSKTDQGGWVRLSASGLLALDIARLCCCANICGPYQRVHICFGRLQVSAFLTPCTEPSYGVCWSD
jgi:hypothetical protein